MDEKYEPISQKDFQALRRFIINSPDADEFTKKAILWLLDQTDNLSLPAALHFPAESEIGYKAAQDVHSMNCGSGKTRISKFLNEIRDETYIGSSRGTNKVIFIRSGVNRCIYGGIPTFHYFEPPELQDASLVVTREMINAVSLEGCEKKNELAKEEIKPITDDQMRTLKQFILNAKDGSAFAKKVLLWLLDQTENLSYPVFLIFDARYDLGHDAAQGVHSMVSAGGQTHIQTFMKGLGTPLSITSDGGCTIRITNNHLGEKPETRRFYVDFEEPEMMSFAKISDLHETELCVE